ncbi:MAG: type I restriction enzyme HsdR N-terminal domain-containing protein [Bacteroidales bacterium]|nr:type I restriction enzyme HsdR N-terminal domain-containing protein [Bacteroidales bacterium]
MNLPKLNFPSFNFQLKENENLLFIFDRIRKKWIQLTPEEWVRQHVIWYLIEYKQCPESLIQVEYGFRVNQKLLRIDVAVFSSHIKPILLCECKSPSQSLTQKNLTQLGLYNLHYKSAFILLTNGFVHYCFYYNNGWSAVKEIPHYQQLLLFYQ